MKYEIIALHDSGDVIKAILLIYCMNGCQIPIRKGDPSPTGERWGWDGNSEVPTISPSINCTKCGFHKTLINGQWQ